MDIKLLKKIKDDTLKSVGNKFDKDYRTNKEKEVRIVLKNSYVIDKDSIDEYIARDGYFALNKAITEMKPEEVTEVVKDSGLKGRSGGGFPTGLKWGFIPKEKGQKYIICNADEGESAATVDGVLMRQDPHSVLEGMALAGYAIGASKGYIYLRYEYPVCLEVLNKAIKDAKEKGLLGKNILGTDFEFEVEVFRGAGAYVCGEESAIINSIEGNRGNSKSKPPFPAVKGLFSKPTLINNVETLSVVPQIILNGADWYKSTGIPGSEGSKVFTLTGHLNSPKTVEVPLGITIRELIELGGGMRDNKKFKAFVTGSPNVTMLGSEDIDLPVAFPEFKERQVMVGSGGVVILDDKTCMVDFTHFNVDLLNIESCGRCTPCRVGTKRAAQLLEKIKEGSASLKDLNKLIELAEHLRTASLCGLGQAVGMTMHTAMNSFKDEFLAHINEHECAAGKCFK
ncbi:NADH-ubiquinone oxidoreductase-F iron-sulfur binding region domain-containing protein [Mycoplasmatota bacterium zrk1]